MQEIVRRREPKTTQETRIEVKNEQEVTNTQENTFTTSQLNLIIGVVLLLNVIFFCLIFIDHSWLERSLNAPYVPSDFYTRFEHFPLQPDRWTHLHDVTFNISTDPKIVNANRICPNPPGFESKCFTTLAAAVAEVADQQYQEVVVSFANSGFLPLIDNLVCSLRRLNIHHYIIIALDEHSMNYLEAAGVNCVFYQAHSMNSQFGAFGSENYAKATHVKPHVSRDILELGYSVILTDADVVWIRDPLPELRRQLSELKQQEAEHPTRYQLVKHNQEDEDQHSHHHLRYKNGQTHAQYDFVMQDDTYMPCTGFYYMRPTIRTRKFMHENIEALDQSGLSTIDQYVNNELLKGTWKMRIFYKLLSREDYPVGEVYFTRSSYVHHPHPYVVHNNWISGLHSKIIRFQEHGLWFAHDHQYFAAPTTDLLYDTPTAVDSSHSADNTLLSNIERTYRPLLTFANYPHSFQPPILESRHLSRSQIDIRSLMNAIAIAYILERDLILPKFFCAAGDEGVHTWCTLDNVIAQNDFDKFHNAWQKYLSERTEYRASSFLYLPETDQTLKDPSIPLIDFVPTKYLPGFINTRSIAPTNHPCGCSPQQVEALFASDPAPLLRFRSMYHSFRGFEEGSTEQILFMHFFNTAIRGSAIENYASNFPSTDSECLPWWETELA